MPWIQEPTLKISNRDDYFVLVTAGVWASPKDRIIHTIPAGFETNFASVPPGLRWYINRNGKSRLPSILHDKNYGSGMDRKMADELFLVGLREQGMRLTKAKVMYRGLRMFGGIHQWFTRRKSK